MILTSFAVAALGAGSLADHLFHVEWTAAKWPTLRPSAPGTPERVARTLGAGARPE